MTVPRVPTANWMLAALLSYYWQKKWIYNGLWLQIYDWIYGYYKSEIIIKNVSLSEIRMCESYHNSTLFKSSKAMLAMASIGWNSTSMIWSLFIYEKQWKWLINTHTNDNYLWIYLFICNCANLKNTEKIGYFSQFQINFQFNHHLCVCLWTISIIIHKSTNFISYLSTSNQWIPLLASLSMI